MRLTGAGQPGEPLHGCGRWPFCARARALVDASRPAGALSERRRAKLSMPAPTVSRVMRSIRMKPPDLVEYGSNAMGRSRPSSHTPISFIASEVAREVLERVDVDLV